MPHCQHVDLLEVHRYCLADTGRLTRLAGELRDAASQRPLTTLVLGTKQKRRALHEILPSIKTFTRNPAIASVYLDEATSRQPCPLYVLDTDLRGRPEDKAELASCHELRSFKIEWSSLEAPCAQEVVFARLLFLITDVLCIFADDVGGLIQVERLLSLWSAQTAASSLPVKPRVLVLTSVAGDPSTQLQCESLAELTTSASFRSHFAALRIENGPPEAVRRMLTDEIELARSAKVQAKLFFTAKHLAWIFRHAVQHFSKSRLTPFDLYACLPASSTSAQLVENAAEFSSTILKLQTQSDPDVASIATYLSTSILADAYPHDGHAFPVETVFSKLYKLPLLQALAKRCTTQSDTILAAVQTTLSTAARSLTRTKTAQKLHARTLVSLAGRLQWSKLRSNSVCYACLKMKPEHCFDCKHAICDSCVANLGKALGNWEHTYSFTRCPLCLKSTDTVIALKPPTAGVRIVAADGGGIRGIVVLELCRAVQRHLQCDLQEFFDCAFGSSSGGLVVLGLFAMKWPVHRCIQTFESMARELFGGRAKTWLAQARLLMKGMLRDSIFEAPKLGTILKAQFGEFNCLFDRTIDGWSRHKIAVTTTNISDSSMFVLSNYNGHHSTPRNGYEHIRPSSVQDEPTLQEAAQATTAAPFLFPPVTLAIGTLQDGGTREHNNPTDLAMWEAKHIWAPSTIFDVVLSLGTGYDKAYQGHAPPTRDIIRDGAIARVVRSYVSSIDGETRSRNTVNSLDADTKTGWYRLNIDSSARLDDVEAMPRLKEGVRLYENHPQIANLARALVASSFFFELDTLPRRTEDGLLRCNGHVYVRGNIPAVLKAFHNVTRTTARLFMGRYLLGEIDGRSEVCSICRRFSKPVTFCVRHRAEKITMALHFDKVEQRISGFPQTIDWFIQQQCLDDYSAAYRSAGPSCVCRSAGQKQVPVVTYKAPPARRSCPSPTILRRSKRQKLNFRQAWL